jgi:hypothetical protein
MGWDLQRRACLGSPLLQPNLPPVSKLVKPGSSSATINFVDF